MLKLFVALGLLLPLFPQAAEIGRGPQPSATSRSWELELKFLDPRRIEVQLPGAAQPEVYWYMVYTVTNPSPRSQRFFPIFQIVTEDLKVHDTDTGINPLVFDAIRARHNLTHKYLVEPSKAIGALLTGDDNARESVAIWRQIDLSSNSFTIYVAGLSGETQIVHNPTHDPGRPEAGPSDRSGEHGPPARATARDPRTESSGNPKEFTLRKTLGIRYNLPGSPQATPVVQPERAGVRWIMR